MIKLNKSTRFAIYAIMELGENPEEILTVKHIAEKYTISEHHVAKVMQQLVRVAMVRSIRGIGGGFQINKDPKEITLMDIVEIFEPLHIQRGCLLAGSPENCHQENACRIAEVFNEIQEQAYYTLKSLSIATLVSPKKIS